MSTPAPRDLFEIPQAATQCMAVLVTRKDNGIVTQPLPLKGDLNPYEQAAILFAGFAQIAYQIKGLADREEDNDHTLYARMWCAGVETFVDLEDIIGNAFNMLDHHNIVTNFVKGLKPE